VVELHEQRIGRKLGFRVKGHTTSAIGRVEGGKRGQRSMNVLCE
jgi:hypothetical protein